MIFATHVMALQTVTSFFKRPSLDTDFDIPALQLPLVFIPCALIKQSNPEEIKIT
jgi:hypothetical protein